MIRHIEEIKYRIFWIIGIILSSILYFSGIVGLYIFLRKKILKRNRTIILTYHKIRDDGIDSNISVSTKNFEKQIVYIKKNFNVFSLNILLNNKEKRSNIVIDNIAITFDDGYKDNFLNAYPILKQHQLPATIFLISKLVGEREEILSIDNIKIMKKNGIDFGSHTATHKVLTEIDINSAADEIINSKVELENIINEKIQFLAYPKGKKNHFNKQIKTLVEVSGYKGALATENGEIDDRSDLFELERIGIRNCPLFVFKVRVSGIFESRLVYSLRKLLKMT